MENHPFLLTRPLRDVTWNVLEYLPPVRFLLTRPLRDVTSSYSLSYCLRKFLLTRPLRDVTDIAIFSSFYTLISTHTPLAGRDCQTPFWQK